LMIRSKFQLQFLDLMIIMSLMDRTVDRGEVIVVYLRFVNCTK